MALAMVEALCHDPINYDNVRGAASPCNTFWPLAIVYS